MTTERLHEEARLLEKNRSRKLRNIRLLPVVAIIVIICTVYALILPAFTLNRSLICGLEEHTHTDECYGEIVAPESTRLICERSEHVHDETCRDEEGCLICESEEHTHTEECFEIIPEHTEQGLICTLSEHVHTDACYDAPVEAEPVFCGYAGHKHNDNCCLSDGTLLCTLPEHEHAPDCYSDPNADLESWLTWETSMEGIELTENWSKDVLAIAESQLGVNESERNFHVDENGVKKGYSRYGAWYGDPYGDWCAMFCAFCMHYAGVDPELFPIEANCQRWVEKLSSEQIDRYRPVNDYPPQPGDVIFFDYDEYVTEEEREADHVGLVAEVLYPQNDEETLRVRTIEGNTASGVSYNTYEINDPDIMGYGELPEPPARAKKAAGPVTLVCWQEVTEIDDLNAKYLIVSDDDYALGVQYANLAYSVASTHLEFMPVTGYDHTYTTTVDENFQWTFNTTGNSSKQTNVGYSNYGLRLSNNTIINTTANASTNALAYSNGFWHFSYTSGGFVRTTYYLNCSSTGSFTRSTSTNNANMRILKQVEITQGGGGDIIVPGGTEKPIYPDYIEPSGAKTGSTSVGTIEGTYYSDAATSQLESRFSGVPEDDGKVLSDKSVIYGADDYGAFETYPENTFGVELSALGQTYSLSEEFDVSTPLDIVFIIDCSGSMTDNAMNGVTVANLSVEALNESMAAVLAANPDNRVGVACFSGSAEELLPLGRYSAPNDEFFPEGKYVMYDRNQTLTPNSRIQRTDGKPLVTGSWNKYWGGTYTQEGIAQGAQILLDEDDLTVTKTVTSKDGMYSATYTVARKPVIVLLSDGEPTYCTENYDKVLDYNRTNIHGSGSSGYNTWSGSKMAFNRNSLNTNNNQGIQGFYTILSANYYKDAVSAHYNTDAYFCTVGVAISESGNDSHSISTSGDDYKRAILNPTADNIAHLENCTSGWCYGYPDVDIADGYRDISVMTQYTCRELYQLLNNSYSRSTVTVETHDASQGLRKATTATVPVMSNPYLSRGYCYADSSDIIYDADVSRVVAALTRAMHDTKTIPVYGFILRSNTLLEITDNIGEGMEMKSDPVLRYNGVNYPTYVDSVVGDSTYYICPFTAETVDGSGRSADLSQIVIKVTTDENGNQSVLLRVPDSELPTYTPNLKSDGTAYYYYEELPIRLIYQVGLTDEAVEEIETLDKTGGTKTYYTNRWDEDNRAYSDFAPTSKNPYYQNDDYDKTPLPKPENLTQTRENAWEFTEDSDPDFVSEILGNNGKLVFHADPVATRVTLVKVSEGDLPILTDTAEFTLYTDENLTEVFGVYTTDRATVTITDLPVAATYYLKETKAPRGFNLLPGVKEIVIDEDGKVVSHEDDAYLLFADDHTIHIINESGYALPETGGSGLTPLYMIGAALLLTVFIYAALPKRRRERR